MSNKTTNTSWHGQVCLIAEYQTSEFNNNGIKRLLIGTSHHVVYDDDANVPVYGQEKPRVIRDESYLVKIVFPDIGIELLSNQINMEIFSTENPEEEDYAIIVVWKPEKWPQYVRSIMPELNNVITGANTPVKHYFYTHRPKGGEFEGRVILLTSDSLVDNNSYQMEESSVQGDSGCMVYSYKDDLDKLVPVCIVTEGDDGTDEHLPFSTTRGSVVAKLYECVREALSNEDKKCRSDRESKIQGTTTWGDSQ